MTEETAAEPVPAGTEVCVTLKGGAGYDAPWIVVRGPDPVTVGDMIEYLRTAEALQVVWAAAEEFAAKRPRSTAEAVANVQAAMPGSQVIGTEPNQWPQGSVGAYYGGGQQLPQQYQPGGNPPNCLHGPMKYIANGKYGPFYACPLPQGTPGKCKSVNAR